MYCSITFKGRKDPQDPKMVKLEMIFYKTGYTRIPGSSVSPELTNAGTMKP